MNQLGAGFRTFFPSRCQAVTKSQRPAPGHFTWANLPMSRMLTPSGGRGNHALRLGIYRGVGEGLAWGSMPPHPGTDPPGGPASVFTAVAGRRLPKLLAYSWPAPEQLCTPRHDFGPCRDGGPWPVQRELGSRTDSPRQAGCILFS